MKIKKSQLDQFYTKPSIASMCYELAQRSIRYSGDYVELEPSAGNGSFYNLMRPATRVGIDLEPKCCGIEQGDFLELDANRFEGRRVFVIGNPPFGRNSSLAVKFFNHSAKFAEAIAFILPKTFKKQSIHNRINARFHLHLCIDLPKNSFLLDGAEYDVPCCFQVWLKSAAARLKSPAICNSKMFEFTTREKANLAIVRVGGRTGKCKTDVANTSRSTHYYVRALPPYSPDDIADQMTKINVGAFVNDTAGVRSMSKIELVQAIDNSIVEHHE